MSVTVITPSLPERAYQLSQAVYSVSYQTRPPESHLIAIDHERHGSAATRNALARTVETTWTAPLDDDDTLWPDHLLKLLAASDGADVVYPYCHVWGRPGWTPNRPFDADALRLGNFIPITTLIRTELVRALEGWRDSSECIHGWEDWDFWLRALDAGARFVCVPEITWTYRFGKWNKTYVGEGAAR